ncbi:MAG: hypothetical protein U9R53_00665 [Chloroflexota bacterium]|nr:hypothetical protein [Chloroflexota bacterium]
MIDIDVVRRSKFIEIRRTRRLTVPGNVLVKLGDIVQPEDLIAEAHIPTQVQSLDIARGLGVLPSQAASFMMRDLGEDVQQGDVVAQYDGTLPRLVRAPDGGKLLDWQNGQVILASGGKFERVKAAMIGEVMEIILYFGAVLRIKGCLIQGVWGNGHLGSGQLTLLDPKLENPLEAAEMDMFEKGQVLAAGHCSQPDIFPLMVKKGLGGLILGSLAPELSEAAKNQPFPIIVLQGFGKIPSDPLSVTLLRDCVDELVCINACERDVFKGTRPELMIPIEEGDPEKRLGFRAKLALGQWVQVSGGKAIGQTGEVVSFSSAGTLFKSGANFPSAQIRLHNDEEITVPGQNLVILSDSKPEEN